ncbi:thioredoxin [Candidatus Nucleicultrix amoebiphila]|jgi:thioredoxin 1|uniref:Thioredoxin n=1 Tax=Candidatus Nucleicultrix amoebiphila FS5 TaxID=1414854 RepID=A0A1W6N4U1_9PROT|nr:thioredoxin [Candidatus Nucleicultrix amoebiphila]ARN84801.1 thioredoxin [Candidatus Nucleicultrix amoebiphila FS5]
MALVSATDDTFNKEVLQASQLVLVDFWAEWCGPCRAIAPILEEMAEEFEGSLKIVKVDIDNNPDAAVNFNVRSIPTLLLFKNGKVVGTQVGLVPKSALEEWVKGFI